MGFFPISAEELGLTEIAKHDKQWRSNYDQKVYEYLLRVYVDEYKRHGHRNPSWDDEVLTYLKHCAALASYAQKPIYTKEAAKLVQKRILHELKCSDPFVKLMCSGYYKSSDEQRYAAIAKEAFQKLRESGYHPEIKMIAAQQWYKLQPIDAKLTKDKLIAMKRSEALRIGFENMVTLYQLEDKPFIVSYLHAKLIKFVLPEQNVDYYLKRWVFNECALEYFKQLKGSGHADALRSTASFVQLLILMKCNIFEESEENKKERFQNWATRAFNYAEQSWHDNKGLVVAPIMAIRSLSMLGNVQNRQDQSARWLRRALSNDVSAYNAYIPHYWNMVNGGATNDQINDFIQECLRMDAPKLAVIRIYVDLLRINYARIEKSINRREADLFLYNTIDKDMLKRRMHATVQHNKSYFFQYTTYGSYWTICKKLGLESECEWIAGEMNRADVFFNERYAKALHVDPGEWPGTDAKTE